MEKYKKIISLIKEAVFPSVCLNCKKETYKQLPYLQSGWFCFKCQEKLKPFWKTICHVCDKESFFSGNKKCAHSPSCLENVSFILLYEDSVVRNLIHGLKYNLITSLIEEMSVLIKRERMNLFRMPVDIIIPLPLHKRKLRQRGFNQAELLADEISKLIDKPVLKNVLMKQRPTESQMKIKKPQARHKNIQGVFKITEAKDIEFKNILLVDDVITTGATLEEASRILLEAGARKVYGFVLAKD